MQQIAPQRCDVLLGTAMLKADFIVYSGVVDQRIKASVLFNCLLYSRLAGLGLGKFSNDQVAPGYLPL